MELSCINLHQKVYVLQLKKTSQKLPEEKFWRDTFFSFSNKYPDESKCKKFFFSYLYVYMVS